jgi:hypothetical protein
MAMMAMHVVALVVIHAMAFTRAAPSGIVIISNRALPMTASQTQRRE